VGCGLSDSGTSVADFRPGRRVFLGRFGHEKWREMGGGVRWWLTTVEGTRRLFLLPATSGCRR